MREIVALSLKNLGLIGFSSSVPHFWPKFQKSFTKLWTRNFGGGIQNPTYWIIFWTRCLMGSVPLIPKSRTHTSYASSCTEQPTLLTDQQWTVSATAWPSLLTSVDQMIHERRLEIHLVAVKGWAESVACYYGPMCRPLTHSSTTNWRTAADVNQSRRSDSAS